jgi:hypothetical protein
MTHEEQLREAIAAHLRGDALIMAQAIPVLTRKSGNLESLIQEQLMSTGAGIVVITPTPLRAANRLEGVHFTAFSVGILVIETPSLAPDKPTASELSTAAEARLHGYVPSVAGASAGRPWKIRINADIPREDQSDDPLIVRYLSRFTYSAE